MLNALIVRVLTILCSTLIVNPQYAGLSDAVSPSARIEDRVQGLRRRCEDGLGVQVFKEAYEFLKRLQERGGVNGNIKTAGGEVTMTPGGTVEGDEEEDDEEAVLEELTNILGEDKVRGCGKVEG